MGIWNFNPVLVPGSAASVAPALLSELFSSDAGFLVYPSAESHLLLAGLCFRTSDGRRYRRRVRTARADLLYGGFLYRIDERTLELVKQYCALYLADSDFLYPRASFDDRSILFRERLRAMVCFCPRFVMRRILAGLVLAPRTPMGS